MKYRVKSHIWSNSLQRYCEADEVIELDLLEEEATALSDVLEPVGRKGRKSGAETITLPDAPVESELSNG